MKLSSQKHWITSRMQDTGTPSPFQRLHRVYSSRLLLQNARKLVEENGQGSSLVGFHHLLTERRPQQVSKGSFGRKNDFSTTLTGIIAISTGTEEAIAEQRISLQQKWL